MPASPTGLLVVSEFAPTESGLLLPAVSAITLVETRVCTHCGEERPVTLFGWNKARNKPKSWCKRCCSEGVKARQREVRLEVLQHYGGEQPRCACCGESELNFLSIDHVGGGGNQHRKNVGVGGVGFYYWLKRNGYPDGFRVLCHNCNMAIGFYGFCPHTVGVSGPVIGIST